MIISILGKSGTFDAVRYNMDKVLRNKGELMMVKNFDALYGLLEIRARDYINYLKVVSQQSTRAVYPQLHVVIASKGRDKNKYELTEIARKWLEGMGYGEHPYLLVFHKDTAHNHIHLVTTRIGKDGKQINTSFELLKANAVLNQIIGVSVAERADQDIQEALVYEFSARDEFMHLLRAKGYSLTVRDRTLEIYKYAKMQSRLPLAIIDQQRSDRLQNSRQFERLSAVLKMYRKNYNPEIYPVYTTLTGGKVVRYGRYTSELATAIHEKLGLQVLFHSQEGTPQDYTIIDHVEKAVFKGSWIMPLSVFIAPDDGISSQQVQVLPLLQARPEEPNAVPVFYNWRLDITDDVDDEAVHGKRRRRAHRSGTNFR